MFFSELPPKEPFKPTSANDPRMATVSSMLVPRLLATGATNFIASIKSSKPREVLLSATLTTLATLSVSPKSIPKAFMILIVLSEVYLRSLIEAVARSSKWGIVLMVSGGARPILVTSNMLFAIVFAENSVSLAKLLASFLSAASGAPKVRVTPSICFMECSN